MPLPLPPPVAVVPLLPQMSEELKRSKALLALALALAVGVGDAKALLVMADEVVALGCWVVYEEYPVEDEEGG